MNLKLNRKNIVIMLCWLLGGLVIMFLKSQYFGDLQMCTIGLFYHDRAEYVKERQLLLRLADDGNINAQYNLGVLYHEGLGGPVDNKKAAYWVRSAHEQGSIVATRALASLYEHGQGVQPSCVEAVRLYKKAIEANDLPSMMFMAKMYIDGRCLNKDIHKGISLLKKASELGHARAFYELGYLFEHGLSGSVDYEKAIHWYKAAYDHGVVDAAGILGYFYQTGIGVAVDCEQAVKFYKTAVGSNDVQAMFNLANMYFKGECIPKDDNMGVSLLKKSSAMGSKDAKLLLGFCYEHGIGVDINIEEAKRLYLKLAKDGFSRGQVNLAALLFGLGGYENNVEGLKWVNKAAAQADPKALRLLRDFKINNPSFNIN